MPGIFASLRAQVLDDLVGRALALRRGFSCASTMPWLPTLTLPRGPQLDEQVGDVRVRAHDRGDLLLLLLHRRKADALGAPR